MCISCSFPRIISLLAVSVITGVSISSGVVDLSFLQAEKINKKMVERRMIVRFTHRNIKLILNSSFKNYKFIINGMLELDPPQFKPVGNFTFKSDKFCFFYHVIAIFISCRANIIRGIR